MTSTVTPVEGKVDSAQPDNEGVNGSHPPLPHPHHFMIAAPDSPEVQYKPITDSWGQQKMIRFAPGVCRVCGEKRWWPLNVEEAMDSNLSFYW